MDIERTRRPLSKAARSYLSGLRAAGYTGPILKTTARLNPQYHPRTYAFVDKNLRHGRRRDQMYKQEEPTVEAMDKLPKRKRNTKASSTFDAVVDTHPNATWALDKEMDMMVEDGVKADGSDMAALEDDEPVDRTKEAAEDMTTGEDDLILPEDWGEMHSLKCFKVHDDNIRMANEEKRKQKELERTALKEAKAAARKSKSEEKAADRKGVKRPRAKAAKKTKKP